MLHKVIDVNVDYRGLDIEHDNYQPKLYTYVLDNYEGIDENRKRPAVVLCPGGAYAFTSDREAEGVAIRLNSLGFQVFVLKYSVNNIFPSSILELATSVAMVRENANEWHVDPQKIIVGGFSAGGHLTASLGVFWDKDFISEKLNMDKEMFKPNALLLSYPVITSGEFAHRDSFKNLLRERYDELVDFVSLEKQVSENTPKTFIWHTYEDNLVPVENSLLFAMALKKYNVSTELHIFEKGVHGLSLADEETKDKDGGCIQKECQEWIYLFAKWAKNI